VVEALLVSNAVLWVLVAALGLVVLALTRQVGLLHERIAPAGALVTRPGPAVGAPAPPVRAPTLTGDTRDLPERGGHDTLLFFLSPSCPVCKSLLPVVERVVRDARRPTRALFASDGGEVAAHRRFASEVGIDPGRYVLSTELGLAYQVSRLPHAVLIDRDGVVRAQGLVNTREHLESLFEASRLGVASLQEHLAQRDPSDPLSRRAS